MEPKRIQASQEFKPARVASQLRQPSKLRSQLANQIARASESGPVTPSRLFAVPKQPSQPGLAVVENLMDLEMVLVNKARSRPILHDLTIN